MLRVITANLNGIRSAAKKGFFEWFGEQNADVLCVQEIKCSQDDMTPEFMAPHDFTGYFQHAVKKGYSGAGVYTRHEPDEVVIGFGSEEFDPEGRYVELRFGKLSVISVYVPSGSSGDERQQAKYRFMDEFMPHLTELAKEREVIVCGDVNPWWSNRGQAYAKNVGWRIDYQIATPGIASKAKRTDVFRDIKFSDHAPLTVDYDHKVKK
jgi:exodeoxyribonuclease III